MLRYVKIAVIVLVVIILGLLWTGDQAGAEKLGNWIITGVVNVVTGIFGLAGEGVDQLPS